MKPLIFIDTNIFLDFYRMKEGKISLKFLKQLENHYSSLILTDQIEMEFRKNRQNVIEDSLNIIRNDPTGLFIPAFVSNTRPSKSLKKIKEETNSQRKLLVDTIIKLIDNPKKYDKVFISLTRIFKKNWEYHLSRNNPAKLDIRNHALKRFQLGYPPRKKNDNSMGDSVNWEWIIDCAKNSKRDIILVSRDGDFGMTYKDKSYLNDWLQKEFNERTESNKKIQLTESLSHALKQIESEVTIEMEEAEQNLIENYWPFTNEAMKSVARTLNLANTSVAKAAHDLANQMNHSGVQNLLSLQNEEILKFTRERQMILKLIKENKK